MKWEYTKTKDETEINLLGSLGWEVYSVYHYRTTLLTIFYLKRRVDDDVNEEIKKLKKENMNLLGEIWELRRELNQHE